MPQTVPWIQEIQLNSFDLSPAPPCHARSTLYFIWPSEVEKIKDYFFFSLTTMQCQDWTRKEKSSKNTSGLTSLEFVIQLKQETFFSRKKDRSTCRSKPRLGIILQKSHEGKLFSSSHFCRCCYLHLCHFMIERWKSSLVCFKICEKIL